MKSLIIRHFPTLGYAKAEAVNTLCINLTFSGENVRKIMITSSHATEGKSSMSMNILRTMANMGRRVALVDADLRRSTITTEFGLKSNEGKISGLAHYLAGKVEIEDVVYSTDIKGALIVPVGRTISNSLPLLNSDRFGRLLDYLAEMVDYVFVDAPPVGSVIDAAQIAKSCDGTLMVVRYNTVRRQELIDAKNQMEATGCPILGTVLTMVEFDDYVSRKYYYKSYYSKYYDRYHDTEVPAGKGKRKKKQDKVEELDDEEEDL